MSDEYFLENIEIEKPSALLLLHELNVAVWAQQDFPFQAPGQGREIRGMSSCRDWLWDGITWPGPSIMLFAMAMLAKGLFGAM